MAPLGPIARIAMQLVVPVVAALARALPAAYAQALQNARKAGVDAAEASAPVFGKRITRSEALQVLNLTEQEAAANPEVIQQVSRTPLAPSPGLFPVRCFSLGSSPCTTHAFVFVLSPIQQFDKYFAANAVNKGGSFYLQSKIFRAKELLTEYQNEKRREDQKPPSEGTKQ